MTAAARKTQPTRSLLEGMAYTKASDTDLRAKWAQFFADARKPDNADDYQASAIAEHQAMNIRSFKR